MTINQNNNKINRNCKNSSGEEIFDAQMEDRFSLARSERYFLDYKRKAEKGFPSWIRMPNLTYAEAIRCLGEMLSDSLESIAEGTGRVRYHSIRLHSEKELDETVELDDGTVCTKREKIFGSMYQSIRENDLKEHPLESSSYLDRFDSFWAKETNSN